MVSTAAFRELALVPVRSTVYVVKVPFVFVWMLLAYIYALLYSVVAKIVSVPLSYVKRAARRIQLTWNWTKSSARAVLPWNSNTGMDRALAVRGRELEDYQFYDTDLRYGLDRALKSSRGRRSRRKAIISSLIRILLDPVSPAESEEEPEIMEEDEDGKVYKLIRDLVQFSRSRPQSSLAEQSSSGHVLDIETLRQHARDKAKLQTLITELDEYVKEMDTGRTEGISDTRGRDGRPSGHEAGLDDDEQEMFTPDLTAGSIPDTDMYMDASEREGGLQASGDESGGEEEYGEEFDDAHSTPHLQCRGLSPVAEVSPEAGSISSVDSMDRNCVDLESELNTALSRLNTLTDELNEVEVSVLESRQTKITETVTITPVPEARQGDVSRKNSTEKSDSSYEDAEDNFPSIPKTSPSLGLEAGHSKRNLATARKARPPSLPKGNHQQQLPADGVGDKDGQICLVAREDSMEFEEESSEQSCDEEEVEREGHRDDKTAKFPPGAVGVLPPSLSDQFQLLNPSSSRRPQDAAHFTPSPQTTADLYSTVKKAPRSRSEGGGEDDIFSESERGRSQSDSLPGASSSATGKSLFIHDLTPPWKQMRSRNSSSNTSSDSSSATPSHGPEQSASSHAHTAMQSTPAPPPVPRRSYTPPTQSHLTQQSDVPLPDSEGRQLESPGLYDRLPRVLPPPPIPSKAGEEGLYDLIPGSRKTRQQHQYLHEKMASSKDQAHSTPPVSWTPQLPPRNGAMLKRSGSAEVMGNIVKDRDRQQLTRHGSERRSSASLAHEHRERSNSSSSSKRVRSSSTERDQERRIKRDRSGSDDCHHHSRSSERSPGEKHKSSSSRSSSSEKHRSSSGRSLSSEKHTSSSGRSSSSEKHGSSSSRSSSSEKHRSSSGGIPAGEKQRSSSEKHRSSDKRPSPPSSKSSEGSGSFVWKILSSAASSKKKSSSPTEASKEGKEGRKERERERKHSSSRTKESSRESGRTRHVVSQRDAMPRDESSGSLKSGVSMHSSGSSGQESLV